MNNNELLPCRYCGQQPIILFHDDTGSLQGLYNIGCEEHTKYFIENPYENEAIKLWNTRNSKEVNNER